MSKLVSTNPSRNYEIIGEVVSSTNKDIENAVKAARTALPMWSNQSISQRCTYITSLIEISKKRSKEIAHQMAFETGRPISSCGLNVQGGIDYLTAYIEMAEEALSPKVTHETKAEIHRVYREPRGVIAAICPWNYPFMNVAWQCGQALIAGNTIVYKNSEENPLFAKLMEDLFEKARFPKGVFNVIYGDGKVGSTLAHADVNMLSFTGSFQTGHILTKVAAEKFIPIVTELGGSSPCIVFDDVEVTDDLAHFIFNNRFLHSGQICSGIKRLIVHKSIYKHLVEKLCEIAASKKIGDALSEDTDLGPLVAKRQLLKLEDQMKDALNKGVKVEYGGKRPKGLKGAYYLPTIVTNVKRNMRIWNEEVFGPVLPIVSFESEAEAVELANDTEYGLSAFIMTNNKKRFDKLARQIDSGAVAQNTVNYFNPKNPFGGYKHSGMGRLHAQFGFDEVTQAKLVSQEK